jgi:reactive chlorine resistance protein C
MLKLLDKLPPLAFGIGALRWSMVFIFAFFGVAKFAAYEAQALEPIVTVYPLFFWLPPLVGIQGTSNVIGVVELATGLLIAIGAWSHRAGFVGGMMGVATFLVTLSFALGGGLWQEGYGFPFMGSFAQFLFKDAVLLAACLTLALHHGHALRRPQG